MFDKSKSIFFEPTDVDRLDSQANTVADVPVESVETKQYRYRVEQSIILKLDGRVTTHGITKQEYLVGYSKDEGNIALQVKLVENVIQFNPAQLDTAIQLICDFDKVKCQIVFDMDVENKLITIKDKNEVLNQWETFKLDTQKTFAFVKSNEASQHIQSFIENGEQQVYNNELLMSDFRSKLFFDIFFDHYLSPNLQNDIFEKAMQSNLFDNHPLSIKGASLINHETKEEIDIRRSASVSNDGYSVKQFKALYDERYKPLVGYSYTSFEYDFRQNLKVDRINNKLLNVKTEITERIKNNVEIVVNHEIKLVDL